MENCPSRLNKITTDYIYYRMLVDKMTAFELLDRLSSVLTTASRTTVTVRFGVVNAKKAAAKIN